MDILGIGPLELVFILLIMIIILGPNQMVRLVQGVGKFVRRFRSSPLYKDLNSLRNLPQTIVDQAELQGLKDDLNLTKTIDLDASRPHSASWTTPVDTPQIGGEDERAKQNASNHLEEDLTEEAPPSLDITSAWTNPEQEPDQSQSSEK